MKMSSKIRTHTGIIQTELDDEVVLMHIESGKYYSLNTVGSVVWKNLSTPHTLVEICDIVTEEFEVDYDTCMKDLRVVLDDLLDLGLIEIEE